MTELAEILSQLEIVLHDLDELALDTPAAYVSQAIDHISSLLAP